MPVGTWDTLGIKIPKPPYISSLKMVGFVHFSNFFIPSEKYYKLQSCWITLYLHIYGPLDLISQKPTWPYNRHHLDWEDGAWLVKVGMNTLVGMVRRGMDTLVGIVRQGMDTLVQSHPLFQALFAARHRGQGLSTSLYSATKYIIYTGISWPFSVGKRQPENTENKRLF